MDEATLTALNQDLSRSAGEVLEAFFKANPNGVKAWEKFVDDGLPPAFRRNVTNLNQRSLIDEHASSIANASSARKGNFGEIGADLDLNAKGYTSLQPRIDGIDSPGHNGIDIVIEKDGKYFIVEGKYTGSSSLNPAEPPNLPRQMSDAWITQGTRLADAVGSQSLAVDIINDGYTRVLAKTAPDGTVVYRLIDSDGYVITGNAGNWTP